MRHATETMGGLPSTLTRVLTVRRDTYTNGAPCYVAEADSAPGCWGYGDTPEDAIEHMHKAIRACREMGGE